MFSRYRFPETLTCKRFVSHDRVRSELKAENEEAMRRSEREKARLERSVKEHFDRAKVCYGGGVGVG